MQPIKLIYAVLAVVMVASAAHAYDFAQCVTATTSLFRANNDLVRYRYISWPVIYNSTANTCKADLGVVWTTLHNETYPLLQDREWEQATQSLSTAVSQFAVVFGNASCDLQVGANAAADLIDSVQPVLDACEGLTRDDATAVVAEVYLTDPFLIPQKTDDPAAPYNLTEADQAVVADHMWLVITWLEARDSIFSIANRAEFVTSIRNEIKHVVQKPKPHRVRSGLSSPEERLQLSLTLSRRSTIASCPLGTISSRFSRMRGPRVTRKTSSTFSHPSCRTPFNAAGLRMGFRAYKETTNKRMNTA
eukprot:ANDGO_04041.mRNA.1 hypothetical protein